MLGLGLGLPFVGMGGGGGGSPSVPVLALVDRFGNPILDRFGNYILARLLFAFEGDSRSIAAAYPSLWTTAPTAIQTVKAVSGSTMADLASAVRLNAMRAIPVVIIGTERYFAVVGPMGANDLAFFPGATDTIAANNYAVAVAAYCDSLYSAGFAKVVLCTELPTGDATHNTRRNILNTIYRSSYPGVTPVTICDLAADAIMGPDNSFAVNPTYWADATHPNATGNARIATVVAPTLNSIV